MQIAIQNFSRAFGARYQNMPASFFLPDNLDITQVIFDQDVDEIQNPIRMLAWSEVTKEMIDEVTMVPALKTHFISRLWTEQGPRPVRTVDTRAELELFRIQSIRNSSWLKHTDSSGLDSTCLDSSGPDSSGLDSGPIPVDNERLAVLLERHGLFLDINGRPRRSEWTYSEAEQLLHR